MHPLQRFIFPAQSLTDFLAEVMTIALDEVILLNLGQIPFHDRIAGGIFEDSDNIIMLYAAILGKELQPIAVVRQMAGRNHN